MKLPSRIESEIDKQVPKVLKCVLFGAIVAGFGIEYVKSGIAFEVRELKKRIKSVTQ